MGGRWIAVALITGFAAPATAQPDIEMEPDPPTPVPPQTGKDPALAKKWLSTGRQLLQKGDALKNKPDDARVQYENALTAYTKAIEFGGDVAVYVELAVVEHKLGKSDEAAKHLRLVIKAPGVKPDVVSKATAKLDEVSTAIGLVTLKVNPAGATVSLSGVELGTAPLTEPLILMPGAYVFSFAADGFQPKEIEIAVEAGSESERGIDLDLVKIIVEPMKPPEPNLEPPIAIKSPSTLPLYFAGGATVAFTGGAAVAGILAVGQHTTFTASGSSNAERSDAKSSGQRFAKIADGAMLGAILAGGFTAGWYLFHYRPARRKFAEDAPVYVRRARRDTPVVSKVVVAPWVQGVQSSGVTFVGSF